MTSEPDGWAGRPVRLLVVSTDPSGGDQAGRDMLTLVASLAAQCRNTELSVWLTESPRQSRLPAAWRALGLTVAVGPPPTGVSFSHVVLTREGALARARDWVEQALPDAYRILFTRYRARSQPATEASADHVHLAGMDHEYALADWADAVWCQDRAGFDLMSAWLPERVVHHIPRAVAPGAHRTGWMARRGVVVAELDGFDIGSGSEEGALRSLAAVAPLHRRHPGLACTLVAAAPTAAVRRAARSVDARIRPPAELADAVAGAVAVIAGHPFGSGQPEVLIESLRAGTPFVATAAALGDLELPSVDRDAEIVAAADRLLRDEGWWHQVSAGLEKHRRDRHSLRRRQAALADALAAAGIDSGRSVPVPGVDPPRPAPRWDPEPKPDRRLRPRRDDTQAATTPEADLDSQYRDWVAARGPTDPVLHDLRREIEELDRPPLISILMPVHDTDPRLLGEAVASVRGQIYGHWQLCLADDGSDRPATRELLEQVAGDDRIAMTRLEQPSGIAAATNAAAGLATGEYVAFLDHDDVLKPHALAQVARWIAADPGLDLIYSDEDILGADGLLRDPHLKPDWSPDQLFAQNYVCHLMVIRRSLLEELGGLRSAFDGSQDYDLVLRATERTDRVGHIPEPLYSWRAAPGSVAADLATKPYAIVSGAAAVAAAMARRGYPPEVETVDPAGRYRARWRPPGSAHVTIVIPTRDRLDLLERCMASIETRSTFRRYQIVIVDNGSVDPATLGWLAASRWPVIRYPFEFNYARMMNYAVSALETDALLFVNNDTEVVSPGWIEALLEQALRPEVGAAGGRLRFPDGRPQHEGISIGTWGDWANNIDHRGYFARGDMVRNTSAVTGACCMIRPSVYRAVGGADERLQVAYNDVDLCLRIRRAGWEIVYTPYAELVHAEGSSRGGYQHHDDAPVFRDRWDPRAVLDPYYSPVFSDSRPFQIDS